MPPRPRFSALPLAVVSLDRPGFGRIGFTPCPGFGLGGLIADLQAIRSWGAAALVTLMEFEELEHLDVLELGPRAMASGLEWHHLPIPDMCAPDAAFEALWRRVGPALHRHLAASRDVAVHCRGGFGRSGTIAARLLVEHGVPAEEAIRHVRLARPGAIETTVQEDHIRALKCD